MRTTLLILICIAEICVSQQVYLPNNRKAFKSSTVTGDTTTYDTVETFEGSTDGYDLTWVENIATDGTVNQDYTTSNIGDSGSQSCYLKEGTGGDVSTYHVLTDTSKNEVWCRFKMKIVSLPGNTSGSALFTLADSAGTSRGAIRYAYTSPNVSLLARMGTTSGTATTDTFAIGDTIYVWMYFSDGATDITKVWWSTTSTKPADGSGKYAEATSTQSAAIHRVVLQMTQAAGEVVIDDVKIAFESFQ